MGLHDLLHHDTVLAAWHLLRPPILALLAALVAQEIGGRVGWPWLARSSAALGLAVGWFALFGMPPSTHALIESHALSDRVRLIAIMTVAASLVCGGAGARDRWVGGALALATGWWMAGAATTRAALLHDAPTLLGAVAVAGLVQVLVAPGAAGPVVGASVALLGALAVTGAAPLWLMLALVPLVCAVILLRGTEQAGNRVAVASGLAVCCIAIVQAAGRLPSGHFGAIDAACLAPLLTLFLAPRLGRSGPKLAGMLAAVIGIGFAAFAARLAALF